MDIHRIIEGCKQNDQTCQRLLYKKYAPRILNIAYKYCRSGVEAKDILQETFIKVFKNLHRYSGVGRFEGWLIKIAVNTALRHYSKNKKGAFIESLGPVHDTAFTYEQDNLEYHELNMLIAKLPEGYKLVFNLYLAGYSHKEIALKLNISEGTSKSQFFHAKKSLKQQIR